MFYTYTDKTLAPGTILMARYEVLNQIGAGGMGKVYLVRDRRLNKKWVLKEILKQNSEADDFMRRALVEEKEMLVKLDHPCLPRIVDVIENEQTFSIVMDYIEGRSLGELIKMDGAQSVENVTKWALQLCDVLGYLHTRKPPIVYRDLKPQNIMLKPDGNIALIDFGTAREVKQDDLGDTTLIGTRGYAAPEQYGGRGQTDQRTDIYGLGATMYALIIGHSLAELPFEIGSISKYRPELQGSRIEKIIARCCESDREKRYQNCVELRAALEHREYYSVTKSSGIRKWMQQIKKLVDHINRNDSNLKHAFYNEKKRGFGTGYQVFISFKHTDDYGKETPDTRLAEDLYKKLRAKGIKVYFSKRSIAEEGSDKFKNSISSALQESRILVVVGTRPDYMDSPWIKREYSEFRGKMKHAKSTDEFAVFNLLGQEMHVKSLPEELREYMSYNEVEKLRNVILKRLNAESRQEELPIEIRENAVWERVHSGTMICNRYQLHKCVKEGKYYKLFEASDYKISNNKLRLVKVINNYSIEEGAVDPEIECLEVISDVSRGVPLIIDYGKEEDITYLVTDYAQGTRLDQLMINGTTDEREVIRWMLDLCETLHSLHTHVPRVIHCNIKPSNIFVSRGRTELINFSAAYVEGHKSKYKGIVKGSRYAAPELSARFSGGGAIEPSSDIYSLGYTMKDALLGHNDETIKKAKKISRGMTYILQKCTDSDPSKRYQDVLDLKNDLANIDKVGIKSIGKNVLEGLKQIFNKDSETISVNAFPIPPVPPASVNANNYERRDYVNIDQVHSPGAVYSTEHFSQNFGQTVVLGSYEVESEKEKTVTTNFGTEKFKEKN